VDECKPLEDGIDPVKHREARTSQFTGVCWDKTKLTWRAKCKGTQLGSHTTEEDAVRAYNKYRGDGVVSVVHRGASTSQFTGVNWDKRDSRWIAKCKDKRLGSHTTEEAAARAYNVEATRVGRPLNVIPPAGSAGAGGGAGVGAGPGTSAAKHTDTKHAIPTTLAAHAPSKNMKL
jgi:hypothetical protein